MTYFPDLSPYVYGGPSRCGDYDVFSIGWLDGDHEFSKGEFNPERLSKIKIILESQSPINLTFGVHICELCGNEAGNGEYHSYNPNTNKIYAAPTLIVHYIEEHQYAPPGEFIEAVFHKVLEENYCGKLRVMEDVAWGFDEQKAIEIRRNISTHMSYILLKPNLKYSPAYSKGIAEGKGC